MHACEHAPRPAFLPSSIPPQRLYDYCGVAFDGTTAQDALKATLKALFYTANPVDSPVPRPSQLNEGKEFYRFLGVADPVCEDMIVRWACARVQHTFAASVCARVSVRACLGGDARVRGCA